MTVELPSWFGVELQSIFPVGAIPYLERRRAELLPQLEALPDAPPVRALEIGAHRGAFLVGMAASHPEGLVVGLEKRPKYVGLANERLAKHKVERAHMLLADAKLAIVLATPLESLDAVYVTFPDPWWKEKHAERRVLDPIFLRILARRLRKGGRLYVKSDVFPYLHWVRECARISEAFRPLPPERWPDERTWTLTTRERKCMRSAIPFGRTYFERRADFPMDIPDAPETTERWPIPELPDAVSEIRGAPPLDKEERRARAKRPTEVEATEPSEA